MKYKYDSRKNCASQMKREQFFSEAHFAMPFPTVPCNLSPVTWIYTFSAKEKDSETGLSYFGSRYYSSDLSIWLSVDPMSDKYPSLSPYVYCANNPIKLVDPNGEEIGDYYNLFGEYLGTDGEKDNNVYLIEDGASEIYIRDNHKDKNIKYTSSKDKNIAIAYETTYEDIEQALAVYKKEGKKEEGGAFDNEGKWHDGKGFDDHVELPISVGRTSIHRHPWDRGNDYSKNYATPEKASEGDLKSFTGFQQNIIVGKKMGNYDPFQGSTNRQPIMSFYGNDGVKDTPQCSITIKAAESIINHWKRIP